MFELMQTWFHLMGTASGDDADLLTHIVPLWQKADGPKKSLSDVDSRGLQ
jgi:hypothetical protein